LNVKESEKTALHTGERDGEYHHTPRAGTVTLVKYLKMKARLHATTPGRMPVTTPK